MSRPIILIEIKAGCLIATSATEDMDILLLDHDSLEKGQITCKDMLKPDQVVSRNVIVLTAMKRMAENDNS
jgi:hypothetical protein